MRTRRVNPGRRSLAGRKMMNSLFSMDRKDYNPEGKVFRRDSARGIVVKDDKVLLVYSQKYKYFKFPGGGIEKDENPVDALIREVCEETGYEVIRESVEEYGEVVRRRRDSVDENAIFQQINLYYFCEIKETAGETKLDDYEAEEGFTAVWMKPMDAARRNADHRFMWGQDEDADKEMIQREERVLDMLDLELRKRRKARREKEFLAALGDPKYGEMLAFVESILESGNTENTSKMEISYSRFEHTKRVLVWAKRLYDRASDKELLSYDDIMIATIFHDVGRKEKGSHALAGVPITQKYLRERGYSEERVQYIGELVGKHSDKWSIHNPDTDRGLVLLMEADLLDDMGAQGVVMDCMITTVRNPNATFTDCLNHISRFTRALQQENPMETPEGRALWEEKTELVERFTDALEADLGSY